MSAINKIEINGVEYDLGASGGLAFVGTRAEYEIAKLIPESQTGYIPSGTLVCITDENRTYVTSGTGAEQTLTLIARVMSAGDGITITDDVIKADTVTFTGTRAEWNALTPAQKAKFNIVNFTDDLECAYQDIYFTTEVKTNKVWYDANGVPHDVYRKVFTDTMGVGTKTFTTPNNINVISIDGVITNSEGIKFPIPYFISTPNGNYGLYLYIQGTTLNCVQYDTSESYYQGGTIIVTIEYTKS